LGFWNGIVFRDKKISWNIEHSGMKKDIRIKKLQDIELNELEDYSLTIK
jgi:hypothetical protein